MDDRLTLLDQTFRSGAVTVVLTITTPPDPDPSDIVTATWAAYKALEQIGEHAASRLPLQ